MGRAQGKEAKRKVPAEQPWRYEEIAAYVTGLVRERILCPGMRAPSIRRTALQHQASIATVLRAYRILEDRGILEARPRSGFYVVHPGVSSLRLPGASMPPTAPVEIAVAESVAQLLAYGIRPDLAPLGCAIPSADLLAAGRLDRFMARAARVSGLRYNVYTDPQGDPHLRQELCRRALRLKMTAPGSNIVVTCGCTEALSLALRSITRRGDTVAIESPTYFGLLHVLQSLELKVVELSTHPEEGLRLNSLAKALQAGRIKACLLSSSFNNPLGCCMSEPKKRAVLDLLQQHDVPLIEDDVYGDIYLTGNRPRPFMALAPQADIIYCSSFSKTLAPGYRIGWLVTERHIANVVACKYAQTLCGPALPQAALADFLSSGGYDNHLRRIRRHFAENIDRMTRAIERSFPRLTRVTRPAGGFVLWLELPEAVDCRRLFTQAIGQGICFAPGDVFSASARYQNCLRLSCGHPWDDRIESAIKTLGHMAARMLDAT